MLWLHIGMPKTGTTALQGFLHKNPGLLAEHGLRYMATGRDRGTGTARVISHNSIAVDMVRAWASSPADQPEAFEAEYAAHADSQCIISSEMFFRRDMTPFHTRFLLGLDIPVRVFLYLRRFDDFIEADYKQRAKNGRDIGSGPGAFVAQQLERIETDKTFLNFGHEFEVIREALPGAEIIPRLYLRDELVGQNVISDFLSVLGVPREAVKLPRRQSNRSLSRVASEALGMFDTAAGFDPKERRKLGRKLQATGDARLLASGDVLTNEERCRVNDILEERNASVRKAFFPERDRLFPPFEPNEDMPQRGHPEELAAFQHAMRRLMRLAAREPQEPQD